MKKTAFVVKINTSHTIVGVGRIGFSPSILYAGEKSGHLSAHRFSKAGPLSAPGGFADHKRGHLLGLDAGHIFAHTASAARIQLQVAAGQFLFFLQRFKPL